MAVQLMRQKNWKLLQYESLSRSEMEELLQACEDFPEVALTLTGEKTYYVVGDEVPELVAYDASTVSQKRRLEVWKKSLRKGK